MLQFLKQLPWRIAYSLLWVIRPWKKPVALAQPLDYTQNNAWFAHPDIEGNPVDRDIPGYSDRQTEPQAAVFFIHPTSFFSRRAWNKQVTVETRDPFIENLILPNQATVFNGAFQIYVPKYPQVTLATFGSRDNVAKIALDTATQELERAFTQFLTEIEGLPFIIAGHSQGAYHVVALLHRVIAGTPQQERLIAAYAPGYLFREEIFAEIGIPLCRELDSYGRIQTWNAVTESHWLPKFMHNLPQPVGPRPAKQPTVRFACTNPLNPEKESVPAAKNKGAYIGGFDAANSPLVPGLVGSTCKEGKLFIDQPADARFRKAQMSAGWYHPYEYGLFFANIRADAERRLANWQQAHP